MKKKGFAKQLILINRDLQFRYARIALLIGLISTLLCTVVILYPLFSFEILRIPRFLPLPILSGMVLALVVNMGCVVMMMIIISHRIAGPIFALSREFAEVGQGIYGRELRSRKGDDLQYLVRSFNDMSVCLKNLTYDDLEAASFIHELVKKFNAEITQLTEDFSEHASDQNGGGDDKGLSDRLASLKALASELEVSMTRYQDELHNRIYLEKELPQPNESAQTDGVASSHDEESSQ